MARFEIPTGADVAQAFADAIRDQWEAIGPDWIEACESVEPFDYNAGASVGDIIDNCCGCVDGFFEWWRLADNHLRAEVIKRVGTLSA